MVSISDHCASVTHLIHNVRPQAVDERSLLLWSVNVSMSVLGVSRSDALDFVRRATNR